MRLAIVADVFPPLRSSGAVQLRDLSAELARQGHDVTVLVAAPGLDAPWQVDRLGAVEVLRLRTPRTRDTAYWRRTIGEFVMPFAMLRNLRRSPLADRRFDGVIWYSPTIFLGPIVKALKRASRCRAYLVIRDIFPQWAADMGLISRGPAYRVLDRVARYQYDVADVIGVQSPGNLAFFDEWRTRPGRRVEVLHNWLANAPDRGCAIDVAATAIAGRRIFVYAGNMGVAQDIARLGDLAAALRDRDDIGFLFVGRGSEAAALRDRAERDGLANVAFHDEIDPDDIPGLYRQCHVGIVSLDRRHRTHNIPGKFLSYMQAGLPVFAVINPGNDLEAVIAQANVGRACADEGLARLRDGAIAMLDVELRDPAIGERCRQLSATMFSADAAARQVAAGLRA